MHFARSAYHEQYLGLFWQSYLPAGKAVSAESNKYVPGLWMNQLHGMSRQDNESAVRRILLAISLTSIGRRDNTPWMVENGIQLYGSSLASLAQKLKDHASLADNNTYVASRLLSLYEVRRLLYTSIVAAGRTRLMLLPFIFSTGMTTRIVSAKPRNGTCTSLASEGSSSRADPRASRRASPTSSSSTGGARRYATSPALE